MLNYYNEIQVLNFQLSYFGGWCQQSKQILQKNNSFFLFDHIAVLQVSLVKFFRGYIFLPSNSEFDLNG